MLLSCVRDRFMAQRKVIRVSLVYALSDEQHRVSICVGEGATVEEAVRESGISQRFPEIGALPKCAVFGRVVDLDYELKDGDRVEILRPLLVDPKDNRRKAAQSAPVGGLRRR
jgi:uncharacterized protein